MPDYRVTNGTHRTSDGDRAEPGDVIDIPESVAEDFPLKFERVEDDEADDEQSTIDESPPADPAEPEGDVSATANPGETDDGDAADGDGDGDGDEDVVEVPTESPDGMTNEDVGDVSDSSDIPGDYATLSKMAANYDGDDIHGAMSGDEIAGFLETLSSTERAALKTKAREEMASGGDA